MGGTISALLSNGSYTVFETDTQRVITITRMFSK